MLLNFILNNATSFLSSLFYSLPLFKWCNTNSYQPLIDAYFDKHGNIGNPQFLLNVDFHQIMTLN